MEIRNNNNNGDSSIATMQVGSATTTAPMTNAYNAMLLMSTSNVMTSMNASDATTPILTSSMTTSTPASNMMSTTAMPIYSNSYLLSDTRLEQILPFITIPTMGARTSYRGVHAFNNNNNGTPLSLRYPWGMPNCRPQGVELDSFQPSMEYQGKIQLLPKIEIETKMVKGMLIIMGQNN